MDQGWVPDILGPGFEQRTLELGEDDHGRVVATLVRSLPNPLTRWARALADVEVLYVHGWSDFFFQTELARFFTSRGARFHALDLRRYGRSIRPGQAPGFVGSLDEYDADIEAAVAAIAPRGPLVLMGHSTGGLTLTLWAARNPGVASALVLSSPWLELQLGAVARQALAPLVGLRARLDPQGVLPAVDLGYYSRAQETLGVLPSVGEPTWRPERGFVMQPAWLAAVLAGHRRVADGLDVACPVLTLLSKRSSSAFAWNEADATSTDMVLVVDEIARSATRLGSLVTIARIDGAIHDVFLSAPAARAQAYRVLDGWLRGPALS